VSYFWTGIIGTLLAAGPAVAETNVVTTTPGVVVVAVPESKEAVEKEFHKVMEMDNDAQAEVDKWIRDNEEFATKGAGTPPALLRRRIQERFEPVRKAYEDFLELHPNHVEARVAYASFLGDLKDEESAQLQLEKALALDTNNPAIYNNLANICGHVGPVKKAFEYYAKAIQLNPLEPVYYHNLGTTVYLFRTDAKEYYGLDEQHVFVKAFGLYSNAMRLDPMNFPLASDVAQTYYGVKPFPTETALKAWTNALRIAHDEIEREGVYIHFARVKLLAGRFDEARAHLDAVTNDMYAQLKERIARNLTERQSEAKATNAPPAK
jgi:tetratricopeptide (TPR) repeat protein